MQTIIQTLTDSSSTLFVGLFFKAFAVLFSFMYLLYAIVIVRQTQEMNRAFTTTKASFLFALSLTQIVGAVLLIVVSFFLI